MTEQQLRLEVSLGHGEGPAPADLAEGWAMDGAPLALQHDPLLASLPQQPPPVPEFDWNLLLTSLHGAWLEIIPLLHWIFLLVLIALNGGYLLLNLAAMIRSRLALREQESRAALKHEVPVSILLPTGSNAGAAIACVRALLRLDYSEFELILIGDSRQQQVLEKLKKTFSLAPFPESWREHLPAGHIRAAHASTRYPRLRLIEQDGYGRADALNAALNCARYPLICPMDTTFILQRDSLRAMGRPFCQDKGTVAVCAPVGIANGATLHGGFMGSIGLPHTLSALFQLVEYLRLDRFAPCWWSRFNAVWPTSRIFAIFHKDTMMRVGGYHADALNPDMELIMRLQRVLQREKQAHRIVATPDEVCWSKSAESFKALRAAYISRQRALIQSQELNRSLLFSRSNSRGSRMTFGVTLLARAFAPLLEVLAYLGMTVLWLTGQVSFQAWWTFLLAAIGLGMLLSTSAVLMNEISHGGHRTGGLIKLFFAALLENLGYRQLTTLWRVRGLFGRMPAKDQRLVTAYHAGLAASP